eukprot:CAMPEP_0197525818 /NCGR_PEP_ID=MMETSP1318-20131121/14656_1 /TAXON_ID=552666 /ORGANISM="Partenskyella glossopodia, Strain RCC365" /LENGTH=366 /DNA_ID=CAMNT_0043079585 /DNA_START=23 /DNA_END=1123 /DNA_ORIENTATION=-
MSATRKLAKGTNWGGKSGRKHFIKNQMDSSQMWGCLHMEKGNKKKTKPQVKSAPDSKHANSKDELTSVNLTKPTAERASAEEDKKYTAADASSDKPAAPQVNNYFADEMTPNPEKKIAGGDRKDAPSSKAKSSGKSVVISEPSPSETKESKEVFKSPVPPKSSAKRRHRRRRHSHKKGDKRAIHYPRSIQVYEEQQKKRKQRMGQIKKKWQNLREGKMVEEACEDLNTREKSNTWMQRLTRKPPFTHYGTNNVNPAVGGMVYGNYMVTHNKAPEIPPNVPKSPQVYTKVRSSIDKPKLLKTYVTKRNILPEMIETRKKSSKTNTPQKAIRDSADIHKNFSPFLSLGDLSRVGAGGVGGLDEGEVFV